MLAYVMRLYVTYTTGLQLLNISRYMLRHCLLDYLFMSREMVNRSDQTYSAPLRLRIGYIINIILDLYSIIILHCLSCSVTVRH
jgi:hypothetical protein